MRVGDTALTCDTASLRTPAQCSKEMAAMAVLRCDVGPRQNHDSQADMQSTGGKELPELID